MNPFIKSLVATLMPVVGVLAAAPPQPPPSVVMTEEEWSGTATCTVEYEDSEGKKQTKSVACSVSGERTESSAKSSLSTKIEAEVRAEKNGKVSGSISFSLTKKSK